MKKWRKLKERMPYVQDICLWPSISTWTFGNSVLNSALQTFKKLRSCSFQLCCTIMKLILHKVCLAFPRSSWTLHRFCWNSLWVTFTNLHFIISVFWPSKWTGVKNAVCTIKRGSTNCQPQLNLYQFYVLPHVSAVVKNHHQAIKNT